jgi:4'-phosphopantetheinyl transferase
MPLTPTPDYLPYQAQPESVPRLPRNEAEVVLIVARIPASLDKGLFLSEEEEKKCARLVREQDRNSFRYRHGMLRRWLSDWTGIEKEALEMTQNDFGKPGAPSTKLYFNMSRSGNLCAFAFALTDIGVDIEVRRDSKAFLSIARLHYHPDEKAVIVSDDDFFRIWTRKEAVMKAEGSGLNDSLAGMNSIPQQVVYKNRRYHLRSWLGTDFILSLACPKPMAAVAQFLI